MSADTTSIDTPTSVNDLRVGMEVRGRVKRIELYGAFVDVGVGQDGLLHISQLGKPNVRNVEDVVKVGEEIGVYILRVEPEAGRIALSLVKPPAMSWDEMHEGMVVTGTVVRLEKFGVFVDIGAERPGMIHVSELASGYVNSPSDVVKVGEEVRARIIKLNRKKHRIDMSLKALEEPMEAPSEPEEDERVPTAMELALRRAMEGKGGKDNDKTRAAQTRRKERDAKELDAMLDRTLRQR